MLVFLSLVISCIMFSYCSERTKYSSYFTDIPTFPIFLTSSVQNVSNYGTILQNFFLCSVYLLRIRNRIIILLSQHMVTCEQRLFTATLLGHS